MAKTCAELISTIRARAGRSRDTQLITASFVLDALNEAQLEIVRRTPGLLALDASSTTDLQLATNDTEKDLSSLNPAHIQKIWILNGDDTRRGGLGYRPKGEFFADYIPVSEESAAGPTEYTRQGTKIVFNCPVGSDYNELYLRIDYTKWATAFPSVTSDATSDITDADKGLILFALAEVYDEIALTNPKLEAKALKTRALFEKWLDGFQDYNQVQIEELHEGD